MSDGTGTGDDERPTPEQQDRGVGNRDDGAPAADPVDLVKRPTSGSSSGSGPRGPKSPGGLNSVGMNSGSGHAHSVVRGERSTGTGDTPGWLWYGCDGCDACDCNLLLRLSTVLCMAAALVPASGGHGVVLALLRFYRRRLTRFTPVCPSMPSCSAYAVAAVQALGPRRGLAAAARRVRNCGRDSRATTRLPDRRPRGVGSGGIVHTLEVHPGERAGRES